MGAHRAIALEQKAAGDRFDKLSLKYLFTDPIEKMGCHFCRANAGQKYAPK
jgi:hypothetical protein